jgi:DNA-binding transcriptional LysR family regulator
MNWQAINFDWNQVRAFLATVEEGSLSAAARATGQTQPTIGRQVAALESTLGVTLFERVGRSLVLTDAGHGLIEHVRVMGEAASRISLTALGQANDVEGLVRISTSDIFSFYLLPKIIKYLSEIAPGLDVEIVASNAISDLQRREADIAIRHVRPTQPDLVARLLGQAKAGFYATPEFLAKNGNPKGIAAFNKLGFIAFGNPEGMLQHLNATGLTLTQKNIKYHSESGLAGWSMVLAGLGVGIMSTEVGDACPEIVQVLPEINQVDFPVWLVTHREIYTSARIRVVYDAIAKLLM